MLKEILFRNKTNFQFVFATIGALIGLTALCLSFQLMLDVQSFHSGEEDLFGPNSVVIQKKVTKLSSLGMNSTDFSDKEVEELRNKEFITDVAPFESADFRVAISEVEGDGLPPFYADMFFQSIPDRFLDLDVDWDWNEESEYIPIVLPRDFIMIINYGIAQSQGFNQISEELMLAARLTIHIKGKDGNTKMIGRVVGFSQKISSILVPKSFLDHANEKYGSGNKIQPNRIFITTVDDSYGELEELMEDMNLDIAKSAIDVAKIKTIIGVVIGIFGIAAVLIMLLSLMGFVQYSQLVLSKASYEIQTLLRLGYSIKMIVKTFIKQMAITFGIITVSAISIMILIKLLIVDVWLDENGIQLESSSLIPAILLALICFGIFVGANFLNVKKTVRNLGE
jgi:FtsX-like permease family